ncbi:MAG: S1-like domain-containing RNA-binding protein [Roseburia sp.]|nr:S1-like domain-containing RNA-binding protein [Ruminococcus sp.]MCM1153761.1 S1-like domain-containing RNA-binding protein [Roseburia sp.]MCM1241373.1 S1-like domain-containing RNA-binding protein [Roseburia sp.]
MIALGEIQTLEIIKKVDFGVYLAQKGTDDKMEKVLLPGRQVPQGAVPGDEVEVFIYRDSKDRLIATTNRPKLTLGAVARLRVVQTGKIGAFLDWGLEKDLLLPYKEQTKPVREGEECLAALYIDKSNRLCATMNVYPYLRQDSTYQKEDKVSGTVYETSPNFGAFVAVDDIYSALIPKKELYGDIKIGDVVTARVTGVKEDGRLDLSIREKAYLQIGQDAEKILQVIESYDGVLPFTDKASPETIRREMQMSKNEFKRAIGHLLKENKITIGEKTINLQLSHKRV